jgi:crossover junction endodeoxyribonuclease RusA
MTAITIPWPHPHLSPNARVHWKAKHRRRHSYRIACSWACAEQKVRKLEAERVKAIITFFPPDNRARDLDNMLGSVKAGLDAIAEAIGVDDSRWAIEIVRGFPVKHGEVRITIEKAAA